MGVAEVGRALDELSRVADTDKVAARSALYSLCESTLSDSPDSFERLSAEQLLKIAAQEWDQSQTATVVQVLEAGAAGHPELREWVLLGRGSLKAGSSVGKAAVERWGEEFRQLLRDKPRDCVKALKSGVSPPDNLSPDELLSLLKGIRSQKRWVPQKWWFLETWVYPVLKRQENLSQVYAQESRLFFEPPSLDDTELDKENRRRAVLLVLDADESLDAKLAKRLVTSGGFDHLSVPSGRSAGLLRNLLRAGAAKEVDALYTSARAEINSKAAEAGKVDADKRSSVTEGQLRSKLKSVESEVSRLTDENSELQAKISTNELTVSQMISDARMEGSLNYLLPILQALAVKVGVDPVRTALDGLGNSVEIDSHKVGDRLIWNSGLSDKYLTRHQVTPGERVIVVRPWVSNGDTVHRGEVKDSRAGSD